MQIHRFQSDDYHFRNIIAAVFKETKIKCEKGPIGRFANLNFSPPKGSCEYLNDVFHCLEWRPLTWRGPWRLPPSPPWPLRRANRASGMSQFLQCIIQL